MGDIPILLISLGIILAGAEVFVNGVEWLGKKFKLSEGAVGSVLAAVGTALPETIVPIIAILFGSESSGKDIGIGAILGAPLMLSTLAMFVTGTAVLVFRKRRTHGIKVVGDYSSMYRDLGVFMIIFTTAVLAGTLPPSMRFWQLMVGVFLILGYFWYVRTMLSQERDIESEGDIPPCYFARSYAEPPLIRVLAQVFTALVLIIMGAQLFVHAISAVAISFGVPAFVLALIITPIATELPEKFNSVIWISREKDTLALGNITGAMVFQSSLIPALGIFLTDWQLNAGAMYSALLTLGSAALLFMQLSRNKHITAGMLLLAGGFYAVFLLAIFKGIITA